MQAAPLFVELYDHKNDSSETTNIASQQPELVHELIQQHSAGWEAAR